MVWQLRWTLLIIGVIFIAALVWWERRRPRQARGSPGHVAPREPLGDTAQRLVREPPLTLPEMHAREPLGARELPVVEPLRAQLARELDDLVEVAVVRAIGLERAVELPLRALALDRAVDIEIAQANIAHRRRQLRLRHAQELRRIRGRGGAHLGAGLRQVAPAHGRERLVARAGDLHAKSSS